jgi:hypothetical protein
LLRWEELKTYCLSGTLGAYTSYTQPETVDGYIEDWHPSLLATKANAEDLPTWNEAMNGPHADGFWKACEIELETLERKQCWEVVDPPRDTLLSPAPGRSRLSVILTDPCAN